MTLLPEKKITQYPKACVVQTHSKTKMFTILTTSNECIIILKLQLNPNFSNLQGKRKLVRKIGYFKKSVVKLQCLTEERETTFVSSYREVRKNEGSRDRDSTVVTLNPRILCDFNQLPTKTKLVKETVNSSSYVKFKKILKQFFVEPLKTALFRATSKKSRSLFVLILLLFCGWK